MPVPADELWRWHRRPGALERLTPPWESVSVLEQGAALADGTVTRFVLRLGPLAIHWTARHEGSIEGRRFRDVQVRGPFASWEHTHAFIPDGDRSLLDDRIRYRLPLHPLGGIAAGRLVRSRLERMFAYRHEITARDTARAAGRRSRRIAVTGATGLIGRRLVPYLSTQGHEVVPLVRGASRAGALVWDPAGGRIEGSLEGFDAVIHLAGEPIGEGRWTARKKAAIVASRTDGTRLLAETIAQLARPPRVFITASAVGYYGDCGEELRGEEDAPGGDFPARVCTAWEEAAGAAAAAGIRTVNLRIGIVLDPQGGALRRLLPFYRLGLGAVMGTGRQYLSWLTMEDMLGIIDCALENENLSGPVNAAAPTPVTNRQFADTLARVLCRPRLLTVPAVVIRSFFGQMGREVLLAGVRVSCRKLLDAGYQFTYPDLQDALRFVLGRRPGGQR